MEGKTDNSVESEGIDKAVTNDTLEEGDEVPKNNIVNESIDISPAAELRVGVTDKDVCTSNVVGEPSSNLETHLKLVIKQKRFVRLLKYVRNRVKLYSLW